MSCAANRLSTPIETLMALIRASGLPENRPPHMGCDLSLSEGSPVMAAAIGNTGLQVKSALPGWAAFAALLLLAACAPKAGRADLKTLAKGEMAKLVVADTPAPPAAIAIEGPDGKPVDLAAFKGKVTLVNLWATWCAPCKIEMPKLAGLQAAYAGKPLAVVPVSLDREEAIPKAKAFIASLPPLAFHHAAMDVAFQLKPPVPGFPTTLILDKQGRERARLAADADWSGADARAVIDRLLAEPG